MNLTNDLIRRTLGRLGYGTPEPGKLHLLGVRGAVPQGAQALASIENTPDRYNDTLVTFGPVLKVFRGSVDPGLHYTRTPLHPDGCAHLLNGGPYAYTRGLHRGKPALVQSAPVRFWRDKDRDFQRDNTPSEQLVRRDSIGLNIHAGGSSPVVGPHSASCQIIAGGWDGAPWREFYDLVEQWPQARYSYWLIDYKDLR